MGPNKYNIPLTVFFHIILLVSTLGISAQYGLPATIPSESTEEGSFRTGDWLNLEQTGPDYCNEKRKTACASQLLLTERIEQEFSQRVFYSSPTNTINTSLPTPRNLKMIDIYVDQHHRSFGNEIVEIFEQSLVRYSANKKNALFLECHCDDPLTHDYSFSLGHSWGLRANAFFQFLAFRQQTVVWHNYGKLPLRCVENQPNCQKEQIQQQSAFRFLAIGEPEMGCLLRLKIDGGFNTPKEIFNTHPLFLQKIHVAAINAKRDIDRE